MNIIKYFIKTYNNKTRVKHFSQKKVNKNEHTTASKYERLCGMNYNTSDIVTVCLKGMNALQSVVIEYSDLHVIRSSDHPILPWNKFGRSYRQVADLEGLD